MNQDNYWCNGFWFDLYEEAKRYADLMLEHQRHYYAIFTKAEIEANRAILDSFKGTDQKTKKTAKKPL